MQEKVVSALRIACKDFRKARSIEEYTASLKTIHTALDSNWDNFKTLNEKEILEKWKNQAYFQK